MSLSSCQQLIIDEILQSGKGVIPNANMAYAESMILHLINKGMKPCTTNKRARAAIRNGAWTSKTRLYPKNEASLFLRVDYLYNYHVDFV